MLIDLRNFAESLAIEAGEMIAEMQGKFEDLDYKSNHVDLVTEVDKESEAMIIRKIKSEYPDHWILSEEMMGLNKDFSIINQTEKLGWVIDPLDGTMNFVHGIPHFAVSISVVQNGKPQIGIVYEPNRKEMFSAVRGLGAFLNGRKLHVSKEEALQNSLLHTGFAFRDWNSDSPKRNEFQKLYGKCRYVKISGSAALDLAYVAAGRLEGYWQSGLSPWDISAGVLLVEEAEGNVTGFCAKPFCLMDGEVMATNNFIHQQLIEKLIEK